MSSPHAHQPDTPSSSQSQPKFKGIRRRKWGKWVSEIRVPGTSNRLWLGSYTTPQAAAIAHDVAFYCLRADSSPQNLNFPLMLPPTARPGLSPRSVQQAASDAGLAIDARYLDSNASTHHRVMPDCSYSSDEDQRNAGYSLPHHGAVDYNYGDEDRRNRWENQGGYYWPAQNSGEGLLNVSVEDYIEP